MWQRRYAAAPSDLLPRISTEQTLIRYIDRLLMFYVRTGDRLQRTSVWMENMEGALDLSQVGDHRGQARHRCRAGGHDGGIVGTWQCEWKSTLADPDKLKLFRGLRQPARGRDAAAP